VRAPKKIKSKKKISLIYDVKLLFPVLFLVGIGVVMIYSASSTLAFKKFGNEYYFLKKQAVFAMAGILVLVFYKHIPYRIFYTLTYPILLIAIVLLTATLFSSFGYSVGGSKRWLRYGGFSIQPSEIVRFAIVIYIAYSLNKKKYLLKDFYIGFLPHMLLLGAFTTLLFLQPDFGSVIILSALTGIMLFVGGIRILHLFSFFLLSLPILYFFLVTAEYRMKRIMSFLNPWQFPMEEGYQITHSLMAFGTGGLWGNGIGKSYQKLFYLPEPHTDFIFSVIGEELGLVGIILILGLYMLIVWRGIHISRNARDFFGALLALGLTTSIGLQVCINMGVSLGLLPTKGLTLPFLSYGGTSLLINMASIGILMNIGVSKSR
jgi:cell division protein FtsW